MIASIIKAEVCVIRLSLRLRQITETEVSTESRRRITVFKTDNAWRSWMDGTV